MAEILGDIEWYRGDSYPLSLTVKNKATKLPIDIDSYSFVLTVNKQKDPVDATEQMFTVVGVLDADTSTGKVVFTPSIADGDFAKGPYYFDVQMIDADAHVRTIAKHKWSQYQDISKS